jgi:hypothetical protein
VSINGEAILAIIVLVACLILFTTTTCVAVIVYLAMHFLMRGIGRTA